MKQRTLKFVSIILIIFCLMLLSGCKKKVDDSSLEDQFGGATDVIDVIDDIGYDGLSEEEKLNDYFNMIYSLDGSNKDDCRRAVEELVSWNIPIPDLALEDMIYFIKYNYVEIDMPWDYTDEYWQGIVDEYERCYLVPRSSEGYYYCEIDMMGIANAFSNNTISPFMEEFFDIHREDAKEDINVIVSDAALLISWDQLARYIVRRQKFISAYPSAALAVQMKEEMNYYIGWLDGSLPLDNTPVYSYRGVYSEEAKEAYRYVINNSTDERLVSRFTTIYEMLEDSGFMASSDIKDYLWNLEFFY